jgi:hypothetical protein
MPQLPKDVQKLIEIYRKAQDSLIKIIAEKEARGNVTAFQRSLLRQVGVQLQELNKQAEEWVDEVIPEYYGEGVKQASAALESMGLNGGSYEMFAGLHNSALKIIARNTVQDLLDANSFVGRQIEDALRQAGLDAISDKISTGKTVVQCKNNLVRTLIDQGLDGIRDKRGRRISLDSYAQTVARSTTREATNRATLNQLTSLGYDLVQMTSHKSSCPVCAPLEGRVYSISGKTPGYPPLSMAYTGPHANIHVNCRHVLTPYIPEFANDPEGDKAFSNRSFDIDPRAQKQIETYNQVQEYKQRMRNDRNQWRKYKLAMPDDTPKTFSGFRRMKYARKSTGYGTLMAEFRQLFGGK